jgi:hypothetical protein
MESEKPLNPNNQNLVRKVDNCQWWFRQKKLETPILGFGFKPKSRKKVDPRLGSRSKYWGKG